MTKLRKINPRNAAVVDDLAAAHQQKAQMHRACAGDGAATWLGWIAALLSRPEVLGNLFLLALFPTVLSFHWMNKYQPLVPTSRAALIYLLEPVFSSVFSVILGYDTVTVPLLLGGGMILLGNLLVELPGLLSRRVPGN